MNRLMREPARQKKQENDGKGIKKRKRKRKCWVRNAKEHLQKNVGPSYTKNIGHPPQKPRAPLYTLPFFPNPPSILLPSVPDEWMPSALDRENSTFILDTFKEFLHTHSAFSSIRLISLTTLFTALDPTKVVNRGHKRGPLQYLFWLSVHTSKACNTERLIVCITRRYYH